MYRVSSKTLHSTHYIVQWQVGNSVDGAYMGAVAGDLVVLLAWLTQAVTVLRGGWWRVCERQHMGQTNNTTEFPDCGSHVRSIFNAVAKLPLYIFVCGDSSATL